MKHETLTANSIEYYNNKIFVLTKKNSETHFKP